MPSYKHLIIGAGMAADAAVKGIRELDGDASIGIIGQEPHAPYARPPLSKKLWAGTPESIIWRGTEELNVTMHNNQKIVFLDVENHEVKDGSGEIYRYERLLLATGGTPRRLDFGEDNIIYFRTLDDYRRLRRLADNGGPFAVIGGGFIGSEIAAALAMNNHETHMFFPEPGICSKAFPKELSEFVTSYYRSKLITVHNGETIKTLISNGNKFLLTTSMGKQICVNGVIAGLGITPNVELALQAGLSVENGIIVDEFLRAGEPDVFAAGDVASFYNPLLGKRLRVEHEDNAIAMGKQAGRNMAGAAEPYNYLPYFYSDLFDLGYEAVGELGSHLETVYDWQVPYRKGVVYYLRDGRVRGVLLWNVWDQIESARRLIGELGPFSPSMLKGRLPE